MLLHKSEQIAELAKALCNAQDSMKGAIKDAENPFFKAKYASLGSVWEACREALTKNGLSVVQSLGTTQDGKPSLITTLLHLRGEWMSSGIVMNPVKNDPQGMGSCISYYRR